MEPRIIESNEIAIAGMVFYGDPFAVGDGWSEENEIGKLWGDKDPLWYQVGANTFWHYRLTSPGSRPGWNRQKAEGSERLCQVKKHKGRSGGSGPA
jgi:hypothetical protein